MRKRSVPSLFAPFAREVMSTAQAPCLQVGTTPQTRTPIGFAPASAW